MIYPLLHKLFGWDYVAWRSSYDQGIARVRTAPDGTLYFWVYKSIRLYSTMNEGTKVLWLTCPKSKYFKEQS